MSRDEKTAAEWKIEAEKSRDAAADWKLEYERAARMLADAQRLNAAHLLVEADAVERAAQAEATRDAAQAVATREQARGRVLVAREREQIAYAEMRGVLLREAYEHDVHANQSFLLGPTIAADALRAYHWTRARELRLWVEESRGW